MKVGADRKRLAMLGGLVLVGGYILWSNFSSDSSSAPTSAARPVSGAPAQPTGLVGNLRAIGRRARGQSRPGEWNPPYREPGVNIDPLKVDPTLRLDLLSKVQQVEVGDTQRNLFQFGEAPKAPLAPLPTGVKNISLHGPQPTPPPVIATGPPKPPPPPAITLKYYGYSNPRNSTRRRAFFLDGEDIIVASEGELIEKRYRLVKIGVNSVTMEDTQFKDEQTLPLAPDAVAG